jgi:L-lactate dehydrogenase
MKIGIIGAGAVGSACLMAVVARGCAREIVVLDLDRKRAQGAVTDVQYGAVLSPRVEIREGDYSDLKGASVIMVTAGVNEKTFGATSRQDPLGRLRVLDTNIKIYKDIVPQLRDAAPNAIVLVITNPPEPLAEVVRMLGHGHVFSSGTFLDSLRFRFHLARLLNVSPSCVDAVVLGEHGMSAVFLWSSVRVAGTPMSEVLGSTRSYEELQREIEHLVRFANITIIEGIQASQYGIGLVSARLAEIILRDERAVIPVGSYNPKYGITLSLPSVLGSSGVIKIFEPDMSDEERQALRASANTLKAALERSKL